MKELDVENVKYVYGCPKGGAKRIGDCYRCIFFEKGKDESTIKCHKAGLPTLTGIHIKQFEHKGYLYTARNYDKNIDGKLESDDPYDVCEKCDMRQFLPNGVDYCLLRNSADFENIDMFMCYEGEIWKKTKIEEENTEERLGF